MTKKRVLTGIKPTGQVHLGNFLGAIKPAVARQANDECFLFIADLHALNGVHDPVELRESILHVSAVWLAAGFDHQAHHFYLQSFVPEVTELMWYLQNVTGMGLFQRAHAFKDAQAKGVEVNLGLFNYPALMAADILIFEADIVPVGKDQKQHIDITRDMAGSFNAAFASVLKLPEPEINEAVMTIPGLDGQKMSKSYGNEIPLTCSEKELLKKIKSITTDSTPLEAPKELEGTLLSKILQPFATAEEYSTLQKKLAQGGMGWGHAKLEAFEIINQCIAPIREKYNEIRKDDSELIELLRNSSERARDLAQPLMNRVRQAIRGL